MCGLLQSAEKKKKNEHVGACLCVAFGRRQRPTKTQRSRPWGTGVGADRGDPLRSPRWWPTARGSCLFEQNFVNFCCFRGPLAQQKNIAKRCEKSTLPERRAAQGNRRVPPFAWRHEKRERLTGESMPSCEAKTVHHLICARCAPLPCCRRGRPHEQATLWSRRALSMAWRWGKPGGQISAKL